MNDLQTVKTDLQTQRNINAGLFMDFVKWIDRSEKTTRTYLMNLKQFLHWIQDNDIAQPTRDDILTYRDDLVKRGLKPTTITAYIRVIRMFFAWTASNGYYPNIAENIRTPKIDNRTHRRDALDADEIMAIEKSIQDKGREKAAAAARSLKDAAGKTQRSIEQVRRLRAMYLLASGSGLRAIEIHRANVKDIEIRNGVTWIYIQGKGHTSADYKMPLAPDVAAAVNKYLDCRKDHYTGESPLFVSTGNRSGGKRIAVTTISTMIKRAMQDAGFNSPRITCHSLRHSAATGVMEITGDLYKTQRYMRHANPATTEIYMHNSNEKQDIQIAEQLIGFYHGRQTDGDNIENILHRMTPAQLAQITTIAAAMTA